MGQAVEITRLEHSASELRAMAGKVRDAAVARRLLALALVLEGHSREAAATASGMTRPTLRDWVHRYNAAGVAGLRSDAGGGPVPLLSAPQMAELRAIVIEGPDPERHRVVRWRRIDLCEEVAERWSVRVCEQTVGRWLRRLRMTRLQPRPVHPKKDLEAEVAFTENFAQLVTEALPASAAGKVIEIWFQDEARVGQKGSLEYIWAPIGSRPRAVRDNRHDSVYLFGALCAYRAVGAAIIMPAANAEAMNVHLKEISTQVAPGAYAVLVCDGAGWHQRGGKLQVPDNITMLSLPPYSPELNFMENVWDYLRGNELSHLVWDSYEAMVAACAKAWRFLIDDPDRIRSITHRHWATVNA